MKLQRIAGLALILLGALMFVVGVGASHSLADRASDALIGRFTNPTMFYIAGGFAATLLGIFTILLGGASAVPQPAPIPRDDIERRPQSKESL